MTYFGFLFRFLLIPLAILLVTLLAGAGREHRRAFWLVIGLHILLAVVYTTPWDNYLVAKQVWGYSPHLVSGWLIGWVPIEEYIFFVLETLLTGLWWGVLARRVAPTAAFCPSRTLRAVSLAFAGIFWLVSLGILLTGWKPGTYLALILVWALPAVAPQLAFGADILWYQRRLVALTFSPLFLYLSVTDAFAIVSGTWTINPAQSLGVLLGKLPIEEALFFGVTVALITFGLTLSLSPLTQARWSAWISRRKLPFYSEM